MANGNGDRVAALRAARRVTWAGLISNVLLAAFKAVVGVIGRSQAVLADAVHSLSDLVTDAAILFGSRYWSAPPDDDHPYGHGKIETVVTLGIGVVLAAAGVGLAWRGIAGVRDPMVPQPGWIALTGAVVSILTKEALYRWTWRVGQQWRSPALCANAWHHRADSFSSVPVAVAVIIAMIRPEWSFVDRIGAVVVAVFIFQAAWRIGEPAFHDLTDRGLPAEAEAKIARIATSVDGVVSVHAVRARRAGGGTFVDLHVQVPGSLSVQVGHDISEQVKEALVADGPGVVDVVVHLEPVGKDARRGEETPETTPRG